MIPREDSNCVIYSTVDDVEKKAEIPMKVDIDIKAFDSWVNYPATAIRRLVCNFGVDKGVEFAIGNDIPGASGMSTSSAMICAIFLVIADRNNLTTSAKFKEHLPTNEDLYGYLGCCENGQTYGALEGAAGVGTFGGSEDHTAIMSCTKGKLNMFSYCETRAEGTFAFPPTATFVIASSGAKAEKTGGAMDDYNNAAHLSFAAADAYVEVTKAELPKCNLAEVVKHAGGASDENKKKIIEAISKKDDGTFGARLAEGKQWPKGFLVTRFEQYYEESEIIVAKVAKAFADADYKALGELVDRSQELTGSHLKNLVPETEELPRMARALGAHAASAFGAGFGGSVWALVEADKAEEFRTKWLAEYVAKFPKCKDKALFFTMAPGPGAFKI